MLKQYYAFFRWQERPVRYAWRYQKVKVMVMHLYSHNATSVALCITDRMGV